MKAFIHNIPEPPSYLTDKVELRGNVYDDAGNLYKSDELIATITNYTENWHWHIHIPNGKSNAINKGECATYHQAFEKVNAYIDQSPFED